MKYCSSHSSYGSSLGWRWWRQKDIQFQKVQQAVFVIFFNTEPGEELNENNQNNVSPGTNILMRRKRQTTIPPRATVTPATPGMEKNNSAYTKSIATAKKRFEETFYMDYKEKYEYWQTSDVVDARQTRAWSFKGKWRWNSERFFKDLEFGTGGLRGILGAGSSRMNKYTVRKATQGLANYICDNGESAKEARRGNFIWQPPLFSGICNGKRMCFSGQRHSRLCVRQAPSNARVVFFAVGSWTVLRALWLRPPQSSQL